MMCKLCTVQSFTHYISWIVKLPSVVFNNEHNAVSYVIGTKVTSLKSEYLRLNTRVKTFSLPTHQIQTPITDFGALGLLYIVMPVSTTSNTFIEGPLSHAKMN